MKNRNVQLLFLCTILVFSFCKKEDKDKQRNLALLGSLSQQNSGKPATLCTGLKDSSEFTVADGVVNSAGLLGLSLSKQKYLSESDIANALIGGDCDMAILRESIYDLAHSKSANSRVWFEVLAHLKTTKILFGEALHLVVKSDSKITSLKDLGGKQINLGINTSAVYTAATSILSTYNYGKINLGYLPIYKTLETPKALEALLAGKLDAVFVLGQIPAKELSQMNLKNASVSINLVPVAENSDDSTVPLNERGEIPMAKFNPYSKMTIPNNSYSWHTSGDVSTVKIYAYLVFGPNVDDTGIANFLKSLEDNRKNYASAYNPLWNSLNQQSELDEFKDLPYFWNYQASRYVSGLPYIAENKGTKFCSGVSGGYNSRLAKGIIPMLSINSEELNTEGSIPNMEKLYSNECNMGIIQSDTYYHAFKNASITDSDTHDKAQVKALSMENIMPLNWRNVFVLVNKNSGINAMADLKGKKVNIGTIDSDSYITGKMILYSYGMSSKNTTISNDKDVDAISKVVAGTYDAAIMVGVDESSDDPLKSIASTATVTLIPASISIQPNYYYDTLGEINMYNYPWLEKSITSNLRVVNFLVKASNLKKLKVTTLIEAIYTNIQNNNFSDKDIWKDVTLDKAINFLSRMPININQDAIGYYEQYYFK